MLMCSAFSRVPCDIFFYMGSITSQELSMVFPIGQITLRVSFLLFKSDEGEMTKWWPNQKAN